VSDAVAQIPTLEQYPAAPPIPTIETYPVTGEPGAVTLHAGGLMSTSHLLAGQGQHISAISSALAPNWSGEAATSYHTLSGKMAGAFASAASAIEGAASLMVRYATELERLQREATAAAAESEHWHQEIVTWTGKVNDARTALTRAEHDLSTAQARFTTAAAQGATGAAAAAAASAAITRANAEVRTAQTDLTRARQQLAHAHEQFTHWQDRARQIRATAMTAGETLAAGLLLVTIAPPPLPGAPDYPALEPTPRILVNDDGGKDEAKGGEGDGQKDGEKPKPEYPTYVARKGKDGKWHISDPHKGETTGSQGDPGEQRRKDERFLQSLQDGKPKEPPSVLIGRLLTGA
jgi:hypothetical protein